MTETEEIKNLRIQLAQQQTENQELKQVLAQNNIHKCTVCLGYKNCKNIKSCNICKEHFCFKCSRYCGDCGECYCETCIQIEKSSNRVKWHYGVCSVCQKKRCYLRLCKLCGDLICRECRYDCMRHGYFCSRCQPRCQEYTRCCQCHVINCGLCWQPAEFKFLSVPHQNQILTLTMAFKYLTPSSIIPPKFVRHLIFRHLIHPKPPLCPTLPRYTPWSSGKY